MVPEGADVVPSGHVIANGFILPHLLNFDGSPYRAPPFNVITWELPRRFRGAHIDAFVVDAFRLTMCVCVAKHSPV